MRKIVALNIVMAIIIFGGILFVTLDFAFNFTGKLRTNTQDGAPVVIAGEARRELMLDLQEGEKVLSINTAGDQVIVHVGRPGENGRILIVSAISAKLRATVNFVEPSEDATPE